MANKNCQGVKINKLVVKSHPLSKYSSYSSPCRLLQQKCFYSVIRECDFCLSISLTVTSLLNFCFTFSRLMRLYIKPRLSYDNQCYKQQLSLFPA